MSSPPSPPTPPTPPSPVEQLQQRISDLEKAASKPILLNFIEVTTEKKVALALGSGKVEGMAGNIAVNALKAEFNVLDPIKIFGIQDKYDEWLLSKVNLLRKKMGAKDQKPEKPLTQEEINKDEIKRAKFRIKLLEERLNKPPSIADMRRDISTNRKWAENRFRALAGEKHGREAPPKGRKLDAIPNVRQLERQEQQLRNTIKQFVRVVKGAIPESEALAKELARIEQRLK
ncbi:hypothetical protein [Streptomyces pseudovenezuelae]|uniref:hypothetical protein n=1 Tax=Streptomyces pseudovenezuelae TaxID=67350 RepID=UPI0036E0AAAC